MLEFLARSDQWFLRYDTFNILRSSSNGGYLHFKPFFTSVWSSKLKYEIWGRLDNWCQRYAKLNNSRSSSIGGRLHFNQFLILVWSPKLEFKIWRRSGKQFLRKGCHKLMRWDGWVGWGGWDTIRKIMPLRGPSWKLRLSRFSVRLKFQDGPSVAILYYETMSYQDHL